MNRWQKSLHKLINNLDSEGRVKQGNERQALGEVKSTLNDMVAHLNENEGVKKAQEMRDLGFCSSCGEPIDQGELDSMDEKQRDIYKLVGWCAICQEKIETDPWYEKTFNAMADLSDVIDELKKQNTTERKKEVPPKPTQKPKPKSQDNEEDIIDDNFL